MEQSGDAQESLNITLQKCTRFFNNHFVRRLCFMILKKKIQNV